MTDSEHDQIDIYERQLDPKLREIYREASPGPEVGKEIRLQRTLLSFLTKQMEEQGHRITAAQAVLIRLILLAMKQETGPGEVEDLLQEWGERQVQAVEDEKAAEEGAKEAEPEGKEE